MKRSCHGAVVVSRFRGSTILATRSPIGTSRRETTDLQCQHPQASLVGPHLRLACRPGEGRLTDNLMSVTPKSSWPWVRTLLHSVFDQPDAESVVAQYDRVLNALSDKLPKVAEHLDGARSELLAFTAFPSGCPTALKA